MFLCRIGRIRSRILFQEFPYLKKKFWGCHLWARGYLGNITDEVIKKYIDSHGQARGPYRYSS